MNQTKNHTVIKLGIIFSPKDPRWLFNKIIWKPPTFAYHHNKCKSIHQMSATSLISASFHPSIHSLTTKNPSLSEGSGLLSSSDDFGTGIAPGIWLHSPAKTRRNEGTTGTWKTTWFPLGKGNTSKRKTHCFSFVLVLVFVRGCKNPSFSECNSWICWKDFAFFGTQDSFRFIF